MKCEDFKSWLEREGEGEAGPAASHSEMPEDAAEHHRSCADCRPLLKEEVFWKRFFAAAPEPVLRDSLWPGVMARIQKRLDQSESFSEVLLLWTRRLAPAFALILLLLGGAAFWRGAVGGEGDGAGLQESDFPLISLIEPDAVLNQWAGATEE